MSEWISVKERLPSESGTEYLCFCSAFNVQHYKILTFYSKHKDDWGKTSINKFWDIDSELGDFAYSAATHWMPLPLPPKELLGKEG